MSGVNFNDTTVPSATQDYVDANFDPAKTSIMFDDFLQLGSAPILDQWIGLYGWNATTGTGGSVEYVTNTSGISAGHPGVVSLNTGTDTTGLAVLHTQIAAGDGIGTFVFGNDTAYVGEWLINIVDLPDITDQYTFVGGFSKILHADSPTFGARFYFDSDGPYWWIGTGDTSSETWTTTSEVVATGWQKLRIEVNSTGTSATFKVNGNTIGTHTTNIPIDGSSEQFGLAWKLVKLAGTTSRTIYFDYSLVKQTFDGR